MNKKNESRHDEQNELDKPDPETLHTTDPQDHLKGPVSFLVQDVKKIGERNKPESKEDRYEKP